MTKRLIKKIRINEYGAAVIEFAIVAWFLIILMLGIIEFGWLFNGWISITSAAREGARIASVINVFPGDDGYDDYILEAVRNHATTLDNVNANIDTYDEKESGVDYSTVEVTATGELEPIVKFFIRDKVTLYGTAKMRLY